MKLLFELRPALDGHAGIPQETRLLFNSLLRLEGLQVDGLLQSSSRLVARGLPADGSRASAWSEDRRVNRLSRVIVSLQGGGEIGPLVASRRALGVALAAAAMSVRALIGQREPLTRFEPARFEDFVWRALFSRTLPPQDHPVVTRARFRIARVPWSGVHAAALLTRRVGGPLYPRLDTRGYDAMIAETPYPGRVSGTTRLVVRYHDAIPLLMPHTIADRSHHQAAHFHALRRNVRDGAWFACVSESTRNDLLSIFPQAEARAVTIPNFISPDYFAEESPARGVPGILHKRSMRDGDPQAVTPRLRPSTLDPPQAAGSTPDYLLMVSTLEPRKNHATLQMAWERLRSQGHPGLQLVLVGMIGWDSKPIVARLQPWMQRGQVHLLGEVSTAELRQLYRHARATVCPSFGEGFGFSGVEAMRCGGVVVASDLPVHREIYGDAAEYFNPYSADDLHAALDRLLGPEAQPRRQELVTRGAVSSTRYLPENVLPRWQAFFGESIRRA